MPEIRTPIIVNLFGSRIHAERAAGELRAEGYRDDRLGILWAGPDGPVGTGGFGTGVGSDIAAHLAALGIGAEASGYYSEEAAKGCTLLVVGGELAAVHFDSRGKT